MNGKESSQRNEGTAANVQDIDDLGKAFLEIQKGEQHATALENQLNAMEAKIERLLAEAEQNQRDVEKEQAEAKKDDARS